MIIRVQKTVRVHSPLHPERTEASVMLEPAQCTGLAATLSLTLGLAVGAGYLGQLWHVVAAEPYRSVLFGVNHLCKTVIIRFKFVVQR